MLAFVDDAARVLLVRSDRAHRQNAVKFYLGTHEAHWLKDPAVNVPLFVSRRRFARLKTWPVAVTGWALDSGGFTEILKHGRWTISAREYVDEVREVQRRVGNLDWAAPMDMMCEPPMLAKSGQTVRDHQRWTVANLLELRMRGPELPFVPVLQGQTLGDYETHRQMYADYGIDLSAEPLVGLGSVCRRQHSSEIGEIVGHMHDQGIALHGFGCKAGAIQQYGALLASCDSMAWSRGGRARGTCAHRKSRCANCMHWALAWREDVLGTSPGSQGQMALAL